MILLSAQKQQHRSSKNHTCETVCTKTTIKRHALNYFIQKQIMLHILHMWMSHKQHTHTHTQTHTYTHYTCECLHTRATIPFAGVLEWCLCSKLSHELHPAKSHWKISNIILKFQADNETHQKSQKWSEGNNNNNNKRKKKMIWSFTFHSTFR